MVVHKWNNIVLHVRLSEPMKSLWTTLIGSTYVNETIWYCISAIEHRISNTETIYSVFGFPFQHLKHSFILIHVERLFRLSTLKRVANSYSNTLDGLFGSFCISEFKLMFEFRLGNKICKKKIRKQKYFILIVLWVNFNQFTIYFFFRKNYNLLIL